MEGKRWERIFGSKGRREKSMGMKDGEKGGGGMGESEGKGRGSGGKYIEER